MADGAERYGAAALRGAGPAGICSLEPGHLLMSPIGRKGKAGSRHRMLITEYFPFLSGTSELGFRSLSPPITRRCRQGVSGTAASAASSPTKVAHGHVAWMKEGRTGRQGRGHAGAFPRRGASLKPSVHPRLVNGRFKLEASIRWLIRPALHFRMGREQVLRELERTAASLGVSSRAEVRRACDEAYAAQARFREARNALGGEAFRRSGAGRQGQMVLVGRPNIHDPGTNMNLPASCGAWSIQTIPSDLLDLFHSPDVGEAWRNMTLAMGQRICTADIIRRDAAQRYLSGEFRVNDSINPRFFGREMGEKPFLLLEIDEHSAQAGVVTRCEAFLDAVANFDAAREIAPRRTRKIEFDPGGDRVLYLPHAANGNAALRAHGIALNSSRWRAGLEWGSTRREGMPACTLMTGDMVRLIKEDGVDPAKAAFFMPGSCGSCRYDLFNTLQQIVFEDMGLGGAALVDEYQGANRKLHAIMSGASCGMLAWRGFIAADILEKLCSTSGPTRPGRGTRTGPTTPASTGSWRSWRQRATWSGP